MSSVYKENTLQINGKVINLWKVISGEISATGHDIYSYSLHVTPESWIFIQEVLSISLNSLSPHAQHSRQLLLHKNIIAERVAEVY